MEYIGRNFEPFLLLAIMIERYSITADPKNLAARFSIEVPEFYKPRFNAAPAQLLPVILLESRGLSFFYWGESPQWAKNKAFSEKWINVRAEQIADKPVLQKALRKNRCLIPADGFYAWKKSGKKTQIPYRFILSSKEIFSIPGLWEEYDGENGDAFHTFTLITKEAKDNNITDRIPVLFDTAKEKIWMNTQSTIEELTALLSRSEPEHLEHFSIEPRINQLAIDDKSLIIPAPPADQFGNLTLFD
jgi:putative SOS response-associated peptidase YedK